jgi:16S rRNA (cytosine1402-N4)-methyltransferase
MNQSQTLDAYKIVNEYEEEALSNIFFNYGELQNAKSLARSITVARSEKELVSTQDLITVLMPLVSQRIKNKVLAQIFQAIRIEVNAELDALQSFLVQAEAFLNSGGRLVCISYHSLEDRLVKRFFQSGNFEGEVKKDFYGNPQVRLERIGKLIVPDEEEIKNNGRARSAKLRIAEKK